MPQQEATLAMPRQQFHDWKTNQVKADRQRSQTAFKLISEESYPIRRQQLTLAVRISSSDRPPAFQYKKDARIGLSHIQQIEQLINRQQHATTAGPPKTHQFVHVSKSPTQPLNQTRSSPSRKREREETGRHKCQYTSHQFGIPDNKCHFGHKGAQGLTGLNTHPGPPLQIT
ncbi:hypothetical protein Nepgr_030861 [Nepenthes gracilis]|uniref:Uncharacterized protein n=1 Tax=Nepenthes gracilis TaxID=150966 RepID=A0AAD3THC6_NEPGR|nr:hypothetical protein Nepgr_030861 [Nepenthes gracilis]